MSELTTILTVNEKGGYIANPESVTVTKTGTTLVYTLDRQSAVSWEITSLSTTDQHDQAGPFTIAQGGSSVSFVDANTVAESFNVSVTLVHRQTKELRVIDPSVLNEPPQ